MDYEASSAAVLVPRIGEQLSQSLSSLKERFITDESATFEQPPCSPLFQSITEDSPTDLITFHHQEEVVSSNDSKCATFLPLDDLDSIDTNELFSFILDDIKSPNSPIKPPSDSLASVFDAPTESKDQAILPPDLDIPLDFLDLLDSSSPRQVSNSSSSFSNPSIPSKLDMDGNSPYYSEIDEDEDFYCSGDDEYVERATQSKRRGRGNMGNNPPLCLHNEDLARGKPGQRLILTSEEKRLLVQMGQRVPTTFPLTRSEERAIKTMRRKIRNKLSAKASRARRQEYVINLESKVTTYQKENKRLRSHIINLEKDRRGLIANIRQMRSQMARLLAGTWAAAGSVTGLKSDATTPPLLPLTVPRQNQQQQQQQQRLRMKSGKPASLLLVALMILASATILPLPGLEAPSGISQKEMAADAPAVAAVGAGATASDQGVLPGRSRVLLNRQAAEVDSTLKQTNRGSEVEDPSVGDDEDEIPVIKTKIRVLSKGPERVIMKEVVEESDPFLLPSPHRKEDLLTSQKWAPDLVDSQMVQRSPSLPYSIEDL